MGINLKTAVSNARKEANSELIGVLRGNISKNEYDTRVDNIATKNYNDIKFLNRAFISLGTFKKMVRKGIKN